MDFLDEAKKLGKVVVDKGIELGKAAKTQLDIATTESKISDCKKRIGDIVYKEEIDIGNKVIKKEIEKIDELMKYIENKKKENREEKLWRM